MNVYEGVVVQVHIFLTLALVGSGKLHVPAALTPGERVLDTHWIWGWVGPRAGLYDVENITDPNRTQTPTPWSFSP
jgi:hypothetical protein